DTAIPHAVTTTQSGGNGMRAQTTRVQSVDDLVAATTDTDIWQIIVGANLAGVPSISLMPGQLLRSDAERRRTLTFHDHMDGLQLSSDNAVMALHLLVAPDKRAIWNAWAVRDLGRIRLQSLHTVGRVQIVARESLRRSHVAVDSLDIVSADARGEQERP